MRSTLRHPAALVLALVLAGCGNDAAAPAPSASETAAFELLDIEMTSDGFAVPGANPRPAGPVTLRVSTPDPQGHVLALIRLRDGVPLSRFVELANQVPFGADPEQAAAALRSGADDVEYFGGAAVSAGRVVTVTMNLPEGTYYFTDGADLGRPDFQERIRELRVAGPSGGEPVGPVEQVILHEDGGGDTRFSLSSTTLDGPILVANMTEYLHEAVLVQLVPGTTPEDLEGYLDALLNGRTVDNNPTTSGPVGLAPISPGHRAVVEFEGLPAGPYVLLSFVRDYDTGVPRAFEGLYRMVEIA